ncbi:hypothetical protein SLE2022_299980 [Rubroshorea leprosula]
MKLQLEKNANLFRPKLIIADASAYAHLYDHAHIRKVCKQKANVLYDYEDKISLVVFPGLQGDPHNHTILGLHVILHSGLLCLNQRLSRASCLSNCSKFAQTLIERGYELVSGCEEYNLVLVNLKNKPRILVGLSLQF